MTSYENWDGAGTNVYHSSSYDCLSRVPCVSCSSAAMVAWYRSLPDTGVQLLLECSHCHRFWEVADEPNGYFLHPWVREFKT